jgi:hypothetical protein
MYVEHRTQVILGALQQVRALPRVRRVGLGNGHQGVMYISVEFRYLFIAHPDTRASSAI